MLFDTDILIWFERKNSKAALALNHAEEKFLSIFSYMELLQGANSEKHAELIKDFIASQNFKILPLSENIGHRASIYIEEYSLAHGLRAADSVIAATAAEHHLTLLSGNEKHFKPIRDIKLKIFRP